MLRRAVTAAIVSGYAIALNPLTGVFSVATAQTAQEVSWCQGTAGTSAEQRISGCTAIIESGRFGGKILGAAFRARGYAHLYAKSEPDWDSGIRDFSQAIELNPEDASSFYGRADALKVLASRSSGSERKKLATSAASDFTQAIRLRTAAKPLDFINRSNAYSLFEDYESALSDLNEALRLDPSDKKEALVNRCRLYGRLGRWPEALVDCNQSLILKNQDEQEADRNSDTLIARGYVYLRMGNYKDAVADYDAALLDPHTNEHRRAEALFGRGFALNKLGVDQGKEDVASAIQSRPEIASYFSERGVQ